MSVRQVKTQRYVLTAEFVLLDKSDYHAVVETIRAALVEIGESRFGIMIDYIAVEKTNAT